MAPDLTDLKWTQNSSAYVPVPGVLRKSKIWLRYAINNLILYCVPEPVFLFMLMLRSSEICKSVRFESPKRTVWSESGTTLVIWSLKKRNRLIGPDPWIRLNSYRSLPDQIQIRSIPDSYRSITDQINSMQRAFGDHLAPPGPVCLRGYICIDLTLYLSVLSISKPALRSYLNTNSETITKHLLGASVSTKACVSTKTCAARGTFALACRVRVSTCTN